MIDKYCNITQVWQYVSSCEKVVWLQREVACRNWLTKVLAWGSMTKKGGQLMKTKQTVSSMRNCVFFPESSRLFPENLTVGMYSLSFGHALQTKLLGAEGNDWWWRSVHKRSRPDGDIAHCRGADHKKRALKQSHQWWVVALWMRFEGLLGEISSMCVRLQVTSHSM